MNAGMSESVNERGPVVSGRSLLHTFTLSLAD
jgi:hypothetical protein